MKTKIDYEAAVSGKRAVYMQGGYPARLVSNKGSAGYSLVGYYTVPGCGEQGPYEWYELGEMNMGGGSISRRLFQEPEVIEAVRYHCVYAGGAIGVPSTSREAAFSRHQHGLRPTIGIVKLTTRIVDGNVTVTGESV